MLMFDACSDAVLCGHLIQQRVRERNAGLTNPHLQFDLHIGIDYGEVVLLENDRQRSDAANLAKRVSDQCPAGAVYFTANVARHLRSREAEIIPVGDFDDLKGIAERVTIHRLVNWHGSLPRSVNPFVWRGGIREGGAFFNRVHEQRRLKDCLSKGQCCQIVGERRIGKTSLLLQIGREAVTLPGTTAAFMDMQKPFCSTLNGFLRRAGREFGLDPVPDTLVDFAEGVETMCRTGKRPVLCIDEFEEFTMRREAFTRDFFLTLRACSQDGMAILTTSHQSLSRLSNSRDPISPLYNIFQFLPLMAFSEQDAADFLTVFRSGVPAFSPDEKIRILDFARCHPLALQVACYYVVEAKERGESLSIAIQCANEGMRILLPSW